MRQRVDRLEAIEFMASSPVDCERTESEAPIWALIAVTSWPVPVAWPGVMSCI